METLLIQQDDIMIRRMQDDIYDYQLMEKWQTDEEVLQFYGGRDYPYFLERIQEKYLPLIQGEEIIPCIFYYQNVPIGYLQYYALNDLSDTERQQYHLDKTDGVYAIDLFIGETKYWNRGIGTKVLSTVIDYLFKQQATKIIIDPYIGNIRAIRCYEKCGFVKVKLLPAHDLHEGKFRDCWLMAIENVART